MLNLEKNEQKYRQTLIQQNMKRATGILHLGAHKGHEGKDYAAAGKKVIWIEALPTIYAKLEKNIEKFSDQKAFCSLLGDIDGQQQKFYISNNFEGVSSSIYQFGEYGGGEKSLWPELELKMIDSITLPMMKLDTLLEGNKVDPNEYDYWIVDLQGAELITFKGAENSLRSCKAIYVEVSTVEVYEGGAKWEEIKDFLGNIGFSPLWTPSMDHDDILFVRDDHDLPIKTFHTIQYLRHNQRRQ